MRLHAAAAIVAAKSGTESTFMVSAYLASDESCFPFDKVKKIVKTGRRFVVGCDANAHNEL